MDDKDTEKSGSQTRPGGKQSAAQAKPGATKQGRRGSARKSGAQRAAGAKPGGRQRGANGGRTGEPDAIQFLKDQHANIRQFISAVDAASASDRSGAIEQLLMAWGHHARLEEEVVVPEAERAGVDPAMLADMQVRRDLTKILGAELIDAAEDRFFAGKLAALTRLMKELIVEEEKPRTGILALIKSAGVDVSELGRRLREEDEGADGERYGFDLPPPKAFRVIRARLGNFDFDQARRNMPGYRYRDEEGRFMSDDDYRGSARSSPSRQPWRTSEFEDYDYDRRGSSRGRMPERDEQGRLMSDDEYRGGRFARSPRGGDSDQDDRRSSRGGGPGGWFGDPAGHSEAARRGWEERDERGFRGRSSRDDDDRRSRGGHGGWFGDPQGHSEAARRGREERDDDRSWRSRGRYSEDDRRRRRD
jgi:hypothetical protein